MTKLTLTKIQENEKLIGFCNKILSYNAIFNNDTTKNMFFVSLISADTLIDKHACDDTIEIATFILNHIDLFILEDKNKKDVVKLCKEAIKIAKRDKKNFEYEGLKDYR